MEHCLEHSDARPRHKSNQDRNKPDVLQKPVPLPHVFISLCCAGCACRRLLKVFDRILAVHLVEENVCSNQIATRIPLHDEDLTINEPNSLFTWELCNPRQGEGLCC